MECVIWRASQELGEWLFIALRLCLEIGIDRERGAMRKHPITPRFPQDLGKTSMSKTEQDFNLWI